MSTILMNSENSKNSYPYRLVLNSVALLHCQILASNTRGSI